MTNERSSQNIDSLTADEATIGGGVGVGIPATSSDPGLAFDTWRQPSTDNPVIVQVEATAETDGTQSGRVSLLVDESGGTTSDYSQTVSEVSGGTGSGQNVGDMATALLPAGAQYQIDNASDPENSNSIDSIREFVMQ